MVDIVDSHFTFLRCSVSFSVEDDGQNGPRWCKCTKRWKPKWFVSLFECRCELFGFSTESNWRSEERKKVSQFGMVHVPVRSDVKADSTHIFFFRAFPKQFLVDCRPILMLRFVNAFLHFILFLNDRLKKRVHDHVFVAHTTFLMTHREIKAERPQQQQQQQMITFFWSFSFFCILSFTIINIVVYPPYHSALIIGLYPDNCWRTTRIATMWPCQLMTFNGKR